MEKIFSRLSIKFLDKAWLESNNSYTIKLQWVKANLWVRQLCFRRIDFLTEKEIRISCYYSIKTCYQILHISIYVLNTVKDWCWKVFIVFAVRRVRFYGPAITRKHGRSFLLLLLYWFTADRKMRALIKLPLQQVITTASRRRWWCAFIVVVSDMSINRHALVMCWIFFNHGIKRLAKRPSIRVQITSKR